MVFIHFQILQYSLLYCIQLWHLHKFTLHYSIHFRDFTYEYITVCFILPAFIVFSTVLYSTYAVQYYTPTGMYTENLQKYIIKLRTVPISNSIPLYSITLHRVRTGILYCSKVDVNWAKNPIVYNSYTVEYLVAFCSHLLNSSVVFSVLAADSVPFKFSSQGWNDS